MRITITMIIEVLTRRVLTLEIVDGPTNLIQWNRFYVSRDYQKPIQPSPDQAPVIRDPAMPMINLSASLLSWSPFRKELDRWSTKLDLFSETSSTKNMSEYSKLLKLQKTQDSNMSKVSNDNSMMTSGRHTSVISRDGTAKNTTSAVLSLLIHQTMLTYMAPTLYWVSLKTQWKEGAIYKMHFNIFGVDILWDIFLETENTPATSTPRSHLTREVSFDHDFPEYPSTPNLKREKALVITSPDLDMIQEASEGSAYGLSRSNTGTTPKSDRIGIQNWFFSRWGNPIHKCTHLNSKKAIMTNTQTLSHRV